VTTRVLSISRKSDIHRGIQAFLGKERDFMQNFRRGGENLKMRNNRILIMILAFSFLFSGCAAIKDKFVPKPKEEDTQTKKYLAVRKYDVHPSLELYRKRYVLWKNWHKELLSILRNANHKKIVVTIEQENSNLMDMHNMLADEPAEKLQKVIIQMESIEQLIKKGRLNTGGEVRIHQKLESLGREIKRDFSYDKMKDSIRSDFRDAEWET